MPVIALGCHTTNRGARSRPGRGQVGVPVEPRRLGGEVSPGPVIVPLLDVAGCLAGPVGPGDPGLEARDRRGLGRAVGDPGQAQHRRDVLLVLGANGRHRGGRVEIIAPLGHAEPALEQERRILGGVVQVLRHPQTQQVLGVEVGVVERVHVGPKAGAQEAGEPGAVVDRGDGIEGGLERLEPGGIDGRRVHESCVVIGRSSAARIPPAPWRSRPRISSATLRSVSR